MKNIKYILVFLLLGTLVSFSLLHSFHTSTTKVEMLPGASSIKITSKLVTEDLEKAIKVKASNTGSFNSAAEKYLRSKFVVKINGAPKRYNFVRAQTSPKATRLYLEIPNAPKEIKKMEIKNALLLNVFPDQQNFITLSINNKRGSFVTKNGNDTGSASF